MLSYAGACGRAGKRASEMGGDETDIASARSSSSAAWSGGFCHRSILCNGSAAPAALQPLPMPKARRRYRNLTVWLPPHVTSAAAVPGRRLRRPSVVVAVVAAASAAAATAAFAATAAHRRHRPPLHRRPPATAAAVACPWTPLHPAPARTARPVATTLLPLLLRCPCIVFCRCVLWLN